MTTITKELSHQDLRAKLERGGMLARRPDLALLILSGQCAYEERVVGQAHGENFALQGSPAARASQDHQPEEARAKPPVSEADVERRIDEIRARHAPSSVPRSLAPVRAEEQPRDASEEFIKAAKEKAASLDLGTTGDASEDLLRSVHAGMHSEQRSVRAIDDVDPNFDPFDFGGAA